VGVYIIGCLGNRVEVQGQEPEGSQQQR
jgi:hypothetical protein